MSDVALLGHHRGESGQLPIVPTPTPTGVGDKCLCGHSVDTLQLSRGNVNSVVCSYLSPTPVGVGVGTSLIRAVDQTLLPARVWLRETSAWGAGWASTRMRNLPFVLHCRRQGISTVAVCETEL